MDKRKTLALWALQRSHISIASPLLGRKHCVEYNWLVLYCSIHDSWFMILVPAQVVKWYTRPAEAGWEQSRGSFRLRRTRLRRASFTNYICPSGEMVYTYASDAYDRKVVEVRVLSWAPESYSHYMTVAFWFFRGREKEGFRALAKFVTTIWSNKSGRGRHELEWKWIPFIANPVALYDEAVSGEEYSGKWPSPLLGTIQNYKNRQQFCISNYMLNRLSLVIYCSKRSKMRWQIAPTQL